MKGFKSLRALMLGGAMALGGALAPSRLTLPEPIASVRTSGKGKGSVPRLARLRRTLRNAAGNIVDSGFWPVSQTVSKRRAHNAARLAAAEAKRARRAITADRNAWRSYIGNPCLDCSARHNPTYVNRSE